MKLFCPQLLLGLCLSLPVTVVSEPHQPLGQYFTPPANTHSAPVSLPKFHAYREELPAPIFDRRPAYVDFYYRAWALGFANFKQPPAGSPLVANFIDEAFNENIFLWDMSFSTFWGNYAHAIFPAIKGLNNFYARQLANGEIVREIGEADGKLGVEGWSEPGTPGNLNHPMLAWAELESYQHTGDRKRLEAVYEPLWRYRDSFETIRDPDSGLYFTDHGAMDDSPRNAALRCGIDVAAQMVIFDRWLAQIALILNKTEDARRYSSRADHYTKFINDTLWDSKTGFYYDLGQNGQRMKLRTIAGFWPLLGNIASKQQARRLIAHLNDPKSFNTAHRVPSHPLDETGFAGNYWDGGVWAPTNTMVIYGLENYGEYALARDIALNHLEMSTQVFEDTQTAWENYYPLAAYKGLKARPDFVGWSGLAPIHYLIRYAIGLRLDAANNRVTWRMQEAGRHGIQGLRYGAATPVHNRVSLIADAATPGAVRQLQIKCEQPFALTVIYQGNSYHLTPDCKQTRYALSPDQRQQ